MEPGAGGAAAGGAACAGPAALASPPPDHNHNGWASVDAMVDAYDGEQVEVVLEA